jgi:hypothetical protein
MAKILNVKVTCFIVNTVTVIKQLGKKINKHVSFHIAANMDVTQKSFAFPQKHNIPLYYVSASDGTNVVKVL